VLTADDRPKAPPSDASSARGAEPQLVVRTRELLQALRSHDIAARALGGVAIAMRCKSAFTPPLTRDYHDLDLVTARRDARRLSAALVDHGFEPNTRFNALHGHSRMVFTHRDGVHLDVLVGDFSMCHTIDLSDRLGVDPDTLSLADLGLTKLQIAELTRKDVVDVSALLIDHGLTQDDVGINAPYMVTLLSRDWGWWRTVTANLELLEQLAPTIGLRDLERTVLLKRIAELQELTHGSPKTLRWRARARLGDRIPWRSEPEEIQ
jgi:hypothetical protein